MINQKHYLKSGKSCEHKRISCTPNLQVRRQCWKWLNPVGYPEGLFKQNEENMSPNPGSSFHYLNENTSLRLLPRSTKVEITNLTNTSCW